MSEEPRTTGRRVLLRRGACDSNCHVRPGAGEWGPNLLLYHKNFFEASRGRKQVGEWVRKMKGVVNRLTQAVWGNRCWKLQWGNDLRGCEAWRGGYRFWESAGAGGMALNGAKNSVWTQIQISAPRGRGAGSKVNPAYCTNFSGAGLARPSYRRGGGQLCGGCCPRSPCPAFRPVSGVNPRTGSGRRGRRAGHHRPGGQWLLPCSTRPGLWRYRQPKFRGSLRCCGWRSPW